MMRCHEILKRSIFLLVFITICFILVSFNKIKITVSTKKRSKTLLKIVHNKSQNLLSDVAPKKSSTMFSNVVEEIMSKRDKAAKSLKLSMTEKSAKKIILFWNIPFDPNSKSVPREYGFGHMKVTKNGFVTNSPTCGNCYFSYEKNLLSVSDAVLFHGLDINTEPMPPENLRNSDQLYVWWYHESFFGGFYDLKAPPNYFNLTMTPRRHSDIYSPYASFSGIVKMLWSLEHGFDPMKDFAMSANFLVSNFDSNKALLLSKGTSLATEIKTIPPQASSSEPLKLLLKKKKRFVVWVASRCDGIPGARMRMELFHSLENAGLKVDVFGRCGKMQVPFSRWCPAYFDFLSNYKFYLAWENAYHCYGYMSEKLWLSSLYSGAVPVIFGPHRDDVAAVLPPKSYIFVEDFPNAHKLVEYLHYLDSNATAYAEYLKWRTWVKYLDENGNFHADKLPNDSDENKVIKSLFPNKMVMPSNASFCELCRKLNYEKIQNKVVKNLPKWLSHNRPECLNATFDYIKHLINRA